MLTAEIPTAAPRTTTSEARARIVAGEDMVDFNLRGWIGGGGDFGCSCGGL